MKEMILENKMIRFEFCTESGKLTSVRNKTSGNEYLQATPTIGNLFRVAHDLRKDFEITGPEGKTPMLADLPGDLAGNEFSPFADVEVSFGSEESRGAGVLIEYVSRQAGLMAKVGVTLDDEEPVSVWSMSLKNIGSSPVEAYCSFPLVSGISLGDGQANQMVVNNQAGYVLPLWSREGGIYGNAAQMSMQWGCVFDERSGDALGFVVNDAEVRNKQIRYHEPSIEVSYFPPVVLDPDEEVILPDAQLLVYCGDWKPTASAYRRWFTEVFTSAPQADWIRNLDGHGAGWFEKKLLPKPGRYPRVSVPLDTFEDLADIYRFAPSDNIEFAFHCSRSMPTETTGKPMLWTDGDNILRDDLGGADALREGIRQIHELGHHLTLYIEGFLCPGDADIITAGTGKDWMVTNKDGTNAGSYTQEGMDLGCGLLHMCPGADGWQDHLARTAARLVSETGADGVRLDSLGFYFFPCFNPEHNHKSPFDYNLWVRGLLEKVAAAVRRVNPDALLTTEAGPDFYAEHFTGCLTQQNDTARIAAGVSVPPMRVAVPEYCVLPHATCGPVAASLMGYPGGTQSILTSVDRMRELDLKWRAVRHPGARVIRWGTVCDDPRSDRDDVVCRRFSSDELDVIVGARPVYPPNPGGSEAWTDGVAINANIDVCRDTVSTSLTWKPDGTAPTQGFVWDIENLRVEKLVPATSGDTVTLTTQANWFMAILGDDRMPPIAHVDLPLRAHRGDELTFRVSLLGAESGESFHGALFAPVLGVTDSLSIWAPGTHRFTVDKTMAPGLYLIQLDSEDFLGYRGFLEVC